MCDQSVKKIFVSVCIADKPELQFMHSFHMALCTTKHRLMPFFEEKCSGLTYLRNKHISAFLATDCTHFCSLDADLVFYNHKQGDNFFDMLAEHGVDFVGGVYAKRFEAPVDGEKCTSSPKVYWIANDLTEMEFLSGGCWLVSRTVVEEMVAAHPELQYDDIGYKGYALFNPYIIEYRGIRKLLSEDWAFGERWKELGGKLWADTRIKLGHIGPKEYRLSL